MRFKERIKLEEQYKNWIKKNDAKDCAFSVITFLEIAGIIPKWIPVEEELPEEWTNVLTVDSDGTAAIDWVHEGGWFNYPGEVVAWTKIPKWEGSNGKQSDMD